VKIAQLRIVKEKDFGLGKSAGTFDGNFSEYFSVEISSSSRITFTFSFEMSCANIGLFTK
jgi:hypothetical protein